MRANFFLSLVVTAGALTLINATWAERLPDTPKKPVDTEYQGVTVEDPYQWLEADEDSQVKAWSDAENQQTRKYLDSFPDRAAIEKQLQDWYAKTSPSYFSLVSRPGILFMMKFQPPKQQPLLVTLASADDLKSEKVVLDPNVLDAKGTTAIDWFVPSLDGRYVAISLSKGGSEDGTLHFYETASGKALPDTIAHVQYPTAGGSAAWNSDGTGVYYTWFPRKGERPDADLNFYQQIYFHKLGTPDREDSYSIGKDFPRIAEITLQSSRDGKYILATVANGDGGDFAHYLLGPDGKWKQITQFSDQIKLARLGRDNALYLLSRANAPRGKILRLPLQAPELNNAAEIVSTGQAVIEQIVPTQEALYVGDLLGGPSQIRRFDLNGKNETIIPIAPISAVQEMLATEDGALLFRDVSYTEPAAWFQCSQGRTEPVKTALRNTSPVSFADVEVRRAFATSKDGTKIAYDKQGEGPAVILVYGALCYRSFGSLPELDKLLAQHFTVYNYDRRGRGDSGDTRPYAVEREVEDIEALIDEAGGVAYLYGHSSGAALALEATIKLGGKVKKLAMYEAPYNDDDEARRAWKEYIKQLTELLAADRRGDAVALFMKLVGTPADQIEAMRHAPIWPMLEAIAPTLAYDHTAILGEDGSVPIERAASVRVPALVMNGGASYAFMYETARALSQAMPNAQLRTLEGQTHEVDPKVLAQALVEFLTA